LLIVATNPSHDGAIAALGDNKLLFSLESEKDSFRRHRGLTATTVLSLLERLGDAPDVIALGGWRKPVPGRGKRAAVGAGYFGATNFIERSARLLGREVNLFTSSHERSHIMMAVGMAPPEIHNAPTKAVLVWEGALGCFYLLDQNSSITKEVSVLSQPGTRYILLFRIADPTFPDGGAFPSAVEAGKLMALAAYGDSNDADEEIAATIDQVLAIPSVTVGVKKDFRDSPVYNAGVESAVHKTAAALLTERIFQIFAAAAEQHLPRDVPLCISGGCGLNCDWNTMWREHGQFSSVFVPPVPNDSGSALGTAIDAQAASTGDPAIEWDVYSGLEFEWDSKPDPATWKKQALDLRELVDALGRGQVVAWVQGRWEIGPRALGNRSLLAEPFDPRTRDRLNEIKAREDYRPVAPCCRLEDAGRVFDSGFEDPHMLYFRRVRPEHGLGAVTHVDGSARPQTVTTETNRRLYDLLSAFATVHGVGVLCNTSLNYKGLGFINRMSDLAAYCESRGVPEMVVGDVWFTRSC
jgi:hydroxymethyl cephem carbamoyltransferase